MGILSAGHRKFTAEAVIWLALCLTALPGWAQQPRPMTNDDVVRMVELNVPDDAIIASIEHAATDQFGVSNAAIAALHRAGVSARVLQAMSAKLIAQIAGQDAAARVPATLAQTVPPSSSNARLRPASNQLPAAQPRAAEPAVLRDSDAPLPRSFAPLPDAADMPSASAPVAASRAPAAPAKSGDSPADSSASATQTASLFDEHWHSMYTRAVAGIDISGASSFPTQQKIFVEFNLNAPLGIMLKTHRDEVTKDRDCLRSLLAADSERFGTDGTKNNPLLSTTKTTVTTACGKLGTVALPAITGDITSAQMQAAIKIVRTQLHKDNDPTGHRLWVWLNPRVSSLPQQVSDLLTSVTSSSPSFNSLAKTNFNQVVQGFELLGGLEWVLNRPGNAIRFGNAALSTSLVVGAGFLTPFASTSANTQEFNVPSTLTSAQITQVFGTATPTPPVCMDKQTPSAMTPCTNVVAFVPPDRTRFFGQYYGGFRLKTFYYQDKPNDTQSACQNRDLGELCPLYPGTFELGVGQNASVSGGKLRGWVLRSEGFYPLPFAPVFHVFYTAWVHVGGHNVTTTPVVLDNTSPVVSPSALGVMVLPIQTPNRDYYRLGVGMDLVNLIANQISKKNSKQPSTGQ
jgi:hypothetical protein